MTRAICVVAILFMATSGLCLAQEVPPLDLEYAANKRIHEYFDRVGKPEYKDRVHITPIVEGQMTNEGNYFVGIRIEVDTGGRSDFQYTFGSVGVGRSEREAKETALEEWAIQFVPTFCDSLLRATTGLPLKNLLIYKSVTGIRGSVSKLRNDLDDDILRSLAPILEYVGVTGTMTIDLRLAVEPDGSISGDCRIWSKPNPQLVELLRGVDWPQTNEGYMFKKYFIVVGR